MNRDIEFRGLDVQGYWNYGYYFQDGLDNHYIVYLKKQSDRNYYYGKTYTNIEVTPETIGQYTGLKDKNGKKIFEGDIVKYDNDYIKQIGVIEWNDKNSSFQIKGISSSSMTHLNRMIVIGNIYENKELLEG